MITELRRRAYLSAMQVASWLPRVELPFAAPSRPELLNPPAEPELEPQKPVVEAAVAEAARGVNQHQLQVTGQAIVEVVE